VRRFPVSLMQPSEGLGSLNGLGATAQATNDPARDTFLVRQLHALAISIYQAKERGDTATVQALLQRFELLADEYRSRGATDLSAIDNFVLTTGQYIADSSAAAKKLVKEAAIAVGETAGAALGGLPLVPLAIGLVAIAVIMSGGFKLGRK
jgi:hypothetical protein